MQHLRSQHVTTQFESALLNACPPACHSLHRKWAGMPDRVPDLPSRSCPRWLANYVHSKVSTQQRGCHKAGGMCASLWHASC